MHRLYFTASLLNAGNCQSNIQSYYIYIAGFFIDKHESLRQDHRKAVDLLAIIQPYMHMESSIQMLCTCCIHTLFQTGFDQVLCIKMH